MKRQAVKLFSKIGLMVTAVRELVLSETPGIEW